MTKDEFLEGLKERILAEGANSLLNENLSYYGRYIDDEVAKGRTEAEVISELGGPNVIAHSVLDAAGYMVDGIPDEKPGEQQAYYSGGTEDTEGEDRGNTFSHSFRTSSWGMPLFVIGIIFIFVILAFIGILALLSPYLFPILLILLLYRMFRRR